VRSVVLAWEASCSDGRAYEGGGELTRVEAVRGFSPGPRELLVSRNAKGRFEGTQLYASADGRRVNDALTAWKAATG
jgi:hypothetical protein